MSHRVKLAAVAAGTAALIVLASCSTPPSDNDSSQSAGDTTSSQSVSEQTTEESDTSSQSPATESSTESETGDTTLANADFMPCVVSDTAGFNDHSFNQQSYEAVKETADKFGTKFKSAESKTDADYVPNVNQLVSAGCTATVASGFNLVAAVKSAAEKNKDDNFVMVDDNSIKLPNVKDVVFATNQAAFLGGYVAAAYSKTGVVATWGGQEIPPVTIYMDGFYDGVKYFNEQNNKNVKVLGWDETTQKGTFVGNFTDQNSAKTITGNFLNQKADVIMPVAGSLYQGAGSAIRAAKSDAVLIGVDADLYVTDTSGNKSITLVSVLKQIKQSVQDVLSQAATQKDFDSTEYIGTLENGGVGLSPFHDFESKVPSDLADQLKTIEKGIIDGSIKAPSPAEPKPQS